MSGSINITNFNTNSNEANAKVTKQPVLMPSMQTFAQQQTASNISNYDVSNHGSSHNKPMTGSQIYNLITNTKAHNALDEGKIRRKKRAQYLTMNNPPINNASRNNAGENLKPNLTNQFLLGKSTLNSRHSIGMQSSVKPPSIGPQVASVVQRANKHQGVKNQQKMVRDKLKVLYGAEESNLQ